VWEILSFIHENFSFVSYFAVLSKEGAVELTQGEGLEIANITSGHNIEIYM
jgi:hypothetical protein